MLYKAHRSNVRVSEGRLFWFLFKYKNGMFNTWEERELLQDNYCVFNALFCAIEFRDDFYGTLLQNLSDLKDGSVTNSLKWKVRSSVVQNECV